MPQGMLSTNPYNSVSSFLTGYAMTPQHFNLRPLIAALALASGILWTPGGYAAVVAVTDQTAKDAGATELTEVVVTASRIATALGETPAPITRLDDKVIADSKPRLVSDVIDRVPGVHMTDLGNEQHSMSIRQPITTSAVYQYLEDNVPIRPIGVFNHNALNEINLSGIEDIEVMRGATSSLYGSNAVGGAVNFLTRAPSATPEAHIGYRLSNKGYDRVDVGASTTRGNVGIRLAYYRSQVRDGWRDYSNGLKDSLSARLDYFLTDASLLKTVLSYTDMYTDMTGSLGETDYQNNPKKSYNNFTTRTDKALRLSSSLETEWSADSRSRVTFYVRDNSHGQIPSYQLGSCAPVPPATTCTTNGRVNDNAYNSAGFDAQWQQGLPWLSGRLIGGVAYDYTTNDYDEDNTSVIRDASLNYVSFTSTGKRRQYQAGIQNPSIYTQLELKPQSRTTVVAGLRYDQIRYDFDNLLTPSATTGAPDEKRSFSKASPRLGISYAIDRSQEVFTNWSQGFVPPEVSQLYGSQVAPDLTEATFRNVDLGYRKRWKGKGHIEVTLYRLDGQDEIVSYTVTTSPLVRENRNAGNTRHQGIELGASWQVVPRVSAYLSASAAQHEYQSYRPSAAATDNFDGKTIPGAPRTFGVAGMDWKPTEGLTITPEVQRIGSYWMNDANTVRYPGHTLVNLRARWQLKQLELFSVLSNVTDKHYAETASSNYKTGLFNPDLQNSYSPGNPRTLTVGVNYAF